MEDFVRRMNMDGYEREWPPIPSTSLADHRGVINEAGFKAFSQVAELDRDAAVVKLREAVKVGFLAAQEDIYGSLASELGFLPTNSEFREALLIAGRLYNFFNNAADRVLVDVSPLFAGSGIISKCRGDILARDRSVLYEVKSGNRSSRSVDYRQLCVYAALHFAEWGLVIQNIGLINPRTGVIVRVGMEDFARQVSGQSAVTLFQLMVECFSSSLVSN